MVGFQGGCLGCGLVLTHSANCACASHRKGSETHTGGLKMERSDVPDLKQGGLRQAIVLLSFTTGRLN